ncbi:MAG TPA: metalloregulator ArsR/SmtB family transcription factor [Polyangiaceae bacterium]|nr:metalloregulator ArsR/SmtB family transcription factor [Polyangiaceae bacterium]
MALATAVETRWQLYRLLSEPVRLRLLALAAEEELALGELSELLEESQPNVSRHAAPLRQAGLLAERRHGTRTFVRLAEDALADPVVRDALAAGKQLCERDGSLSRIAGVVREREARTREFFAEPRGAEPLELVPELPAYLFALRTLLPERELAVDAGTGDGRLLDVLAPLYRRVIGIDRSEAQLARARRRVARHGYDNVTLMCGELDERAVLAAVAPGADLVIAARVLHHAPRPRATLRALAGLLRPSGRLVVIDYQRHTDDAFREHQADVWNGFEASELEGHARAAGLVDPEVRPLPENLAEGAPDGHLGWQVLVARPAHATAYTERHDRSEERENRTDGTTRIR